MVPITCPLNYLGQNAEFTLDLCKEICPLVTKKSKVLWANVLLQLTLLFIFVYILCFIVFFFIFLNQCIVNKRVLLALIVRKVRCVLLLALAAVRPVTCHKPLCMLRTERARFIRPGLQVPSQVYKKSRAYRGPDHYEDIPLQVLSWKGWLCLCWCPRTFWPQGQN